MTGIQFVTDVEGRKIAVQIDLRKHGRSGKTSRISLFPGRVGTRRAFRSKK